MTDNEIIKALNGADGLEHISLYCADNNGEDVTSIKIVDIIDLINRQQAEIERYKGVIKLLEKNVLTAKNEAVKEFAKRLKAEYADFDELHEEIRHDNLILAIDNLVKEMMEQSVNYGSSKTEG